VISGLVLAGEVDLAAPSRTMAEFAAMFPGAELVVQTAGHYPCLDDAERFVAAIAAFLDGWARPDSWYGRPHHRQTPGPNHRKPG
jgi:hypothetical protein